MGTLPTVGSLRVIMPTLEVTAARRRGHWLNSHQRYEKKYRRVPYEPMHGVFPGKVRAQENIQTYPPSTSFVRPLD